MVTIYHWTRLSFPEDFVHHRNRCENPETSNYFHIPSPSRYLPTSSGQFFSFTSVSPIFLCQRATFVIVGWFAGLTSRNHSKWCNWPLNLLCNFYNIYTIYKCGRGLETCTWQHSGIIYPAAISVKLGVHVLHLLTGQWHKASCSRQNNTNCIVLAVTCSWWPSFKYVIRVSESQTGFVRCSIVCFFEYAQRCT